MHNTIDPFLVESTPAVLSVGMRCIDDGYDFVWCMGSKKQDPFFTKPNGDKIYLKVNDYVPYLIGDGSKSSVSATAFKGAIISRKDVTPSVIEPPEEPPVEPDHDRLSAYTPLIAPEAPDIEELQGEEPLERGYVEAPREGSFEKSEGSSSSVLDVDVSAKRDLGEKTLNVEAMSKGHPPPYSHAQEPLL